MRTFSKIIFSLIILISIFSYITPKVEAWGYVQNLNNNFWVNIGSKIECDAAVIDDSLSVEKVCKEYDPNAPAGTYYFNEIQSNGTKKTSSYAGISLCVNARNDLIEKTPIMLRANISECALLNLNNNDDVYTFDPTTDSSNKDSTYTLLAPIGGLTTAPDNIGDYFNTMFEIAIGICAVLAVVMIVIGGIQYMGNESIFGKTEAKTQIWHAILGLLIALASFALLNTIDPALLGIKGVTIKQVSAGIEENVTEVGAGVNIGGTTIKINKGSAVNCKGGIVNNDLGSGKICKDLLDKLKILKSTYPNFVITSTIRGKNAASSCHYEGHPNSGNCADLQITNNPRQGYTKTTGSTNSEWSNFCVAVARVGSLNYLNEASSIDTCQNIQKYKAYPQTSGPHLHVNLISN